ncbi:MAG: hypothetical protein ACK528_10240 [Alphaproteobacteria bacterium]|jgi:hypothetical protein
MTKKYVIHSETFKTYVPNTDTWITDGWTDDINEAKVFEGYDDALDGFVAIYQHFGDKGWGRSSHVICTVNETVTLSIGDKITIDNKDTVLSLLEAILKYGVESRDVLDMQRIINYVKAKGT